MANIKLQSAISFLCSTFEHFDILQIYNSTSEIDIVFSVDGQELELFSNSDSFFENGKFVIIENN